MKKSSIIITAENKEKTILSTIQSCLKQDIKNIEIFVVYSKLNNENILKKKINSKKVRFIKIKKIQNKIHDQINKIKKIMRLTNSQTIFLLDGDDRFEKNKIRTVNELLRKSKKKMVLNNHLIIDNIYYKKKKFNIPSDFEKNFIYKIFINNWPKNICTSGISIRKNFLIKFFNDIRYEKFQHLAIDALLVLYAIKKKELIFEKKILTLKIDEKYSVDKKFTGILNFFFWERRFEQHKFNLDLNKLNILSLDLIITVLIYSFFKILSKTFSISR